MIVIYSYSLLIAERDTSPQKLVAPAKVGKRLWQRLLLLFLLLGSVGQGWAQAPPAFCTATTDLGTLSFTTTFQNTASLAAGSTYFWRINAVAGFTYSFSTCGAVDDTYLRIYDGTGAIIASRDDNGPYCTSSQAASIDWVPTTSGVYFLHLARYDCNPLANATTMAYKYLPVPTITAITLNPGGLGQSITLTGSRLDNPTALIINGANALGNIISNSGTSLAVLVPATATASGNVSITTAGGTATSAFTLMAAPGNALAFDGTDDYVSIPNSAAYSNISTAITIEAWVRTSDTGERYITTKSNDSWYLAVNGGGSGAGKATFYLNNVSSSSGGWLAGSTTISDGHWHHVAGTYDGTTLKIYVDGVLDASRAVTSTIQSGGTSAVYVGFRPGSTNWNGSIDEFRIYNTALAQANIQADMRSTNASAPGNQVLYLNFDQGIPATASTGANTDYTTLYDLVSAAPGTLTNFALTSGNTTSNYVESYALVVPIATAATVMNPTDFTANWTAPLVGTVDNGYRLDVATNATFTAGLTTTTVAGLSQVVTGLIPGTTYYYRVRADKTSVTGQAAYSNTITVAPCDLPQAMAQNVTVTLNASGTATITATAVNNGSTVNCGPAAAGSMSLSTTTFSCADAVPNTASNTALGFTGSQYAQGVHPLLPQGNAPRTIEAWVYPTVASQGGDIFNYGTASANQRSGLTINGTNLYYVGESNDQAGSTALTPNVWHHVAATYDGTTLKLYVDGALNATKTVTTAFATTGTTWRMSQRALPGSGEFLNGRLDEVRVWTRALTAAEITQSAGKTNPTSLAGLVARWDMHEGSGSSLSDVTGNSAAATITGTATWPTPGIAYDGVMTVLTVADTNGNTSRAAATVTVVDNTPPILTACGMGTPASPFTNLSCAKGVATGTYTFSIGGNTFLGYVDGTTDGGGWVEILNYVHLGGTNPALNVRTTNLPVQTSAVLGANESGTAAWGHAAPALVATLNPLEVRFYGQTSAHSRVIDFKTSLAAVLSYLKTGTGSMSNLGAAGTFTALPGHTANLPAAVDSYFSTQGTIAATEFPFYTSGTYHWGIHGLGSRWEVDDYLNNGNASTIHRIFVRGSATGVPGNAVVAANSTGQCGANVTLTSTQPTTDNCSATITFSPASGSFFAVGTTPVTFTATDASGNSIISMFTVTVNDSQAPTALAQAVSTSVNTTGRVYVSPTAVNNGSTDNCAITNMALSASSFGACAASAALNLDGADDYVSLPSGVTSTATNFTFETWVNYTDHGYWTRIMDFGTGPNVYMMLTPKANWDAASSNHVAFAISTGGNPTEQRISTSTVMPTGWHHLAVTLSKNSSSGVVTGTIYLDGSVIGTNGAMALTPADLGTLNQNWLGRSQNAADPYYQGQLDEVRIWSTARTAAEINLYKDKSLAGNTSGLLAYYDFNDAPNNTVADRTAAARTGTLNNFTQATAFQAPGQVPALGIGTNSVTLTVSDSFGNVTSTTATVTVTVPTPTVATWTGTLTTDWTDCRNWLYSTLPSALTDVVIPVVGTGLYPTLAAGTGNSNNLTLASGASLTVASGATLQVNGDWTNNGGTASLSGTVTFTGSAATQNLAGSAATTFGTLGVNKASGNVQLGQSIPVSTALTLTSGTLTTTSSYQLSLGALASISETETSYVIGKVTVTRTVTASSAQPFSGLGLTLTPAAGSTAPGSTVVTRTTGTALTGVGTSQSVQRYFDIQPTTNAGLNVTMDFTYFNHELNGIPVASLALFKSVSGGTPWIPQRNTTAGTNLVTKTGITDLSTWTLGNSANPLPVELTTFTATPEGNAAVRLGWTTASEKNSDRFEVERSLSGTTFERIGTVAGQGTKATATDYAYLDAQVPKSPSPKAPIYYRLRQLDRDGTVSYSPVRTVVFTQSLNHSVTVFPNPARATTLAGAQPGAPVEVFDALGRLVLSATADAAGTAALTLPAGLATGVYVVRSGTHAVRLVVE